ncbi:MULTISPECIES: NYN domain-containing protein [unclassified Afipia]|uniref:NYN domain-containing protein n=1 Tax=unclassified Afipia TaxID=2642050 RepID=UPI0004678957|nr:MULTISPECIES: NYN domain-containing protein [unclassified Afipia]
MTNDEISPISTSIHAVGLPAAPGGPRAAGSILRAAVYIDGFNLYHAIADLGAPHLKWVNLHALSQQIIRKNERLERVVWCTAVNTKNTQKMLRWREYKKAQESVGVVTMVGHFTEEPRRCHEGHNYFHPTEKEGDVNLAISVISDGHLDVYDVAYVVSADSDQVATAKMLADRLPKKQFISVAPPGRSHSKEIISNSHGTRTIRREVIENCLFEGPTIIQNGELKAARPALYAPPQNWKPANL